jgi:hypothetical protein
LFLSVVFAAPLRILPAHAGTGEVCLADPTTAAGSSTPCPSPAPVFDGVTKEQIRIGVFIQGSDALNGFDIVLLANHSTLVPTGVDLAGTILPGTPTVVLECFQGVLKLGSVCDANDTVDTLHFTVSGGFGLLTVAPTTGLLFTAIYNVTSTTSAGGIPVGYRTNGCTGTSVTGLCVTIPGGSSGPNPETAQGGSFDNSTPPPFVTLSASRSSFGPEFPGTTNTTTITATAMNGYPSFSSTDSVDFTTVATSGLTASLSGTNPCATGSVSCSISLSLSAIAAGNYSVTVFGTYPTADASSNPDTLAANVTINVVVYDFGFSISPTTISFGSGLSGTATITLTSLNHFAGSVAFSTGTIIGGTGLSVSYNPASVSLTADVTMTSIITFSASPSVATTYHVQSIGATSGTRVKNSGTLTVHVAAPQPDFSITANPASVPPMAVGVQGNSTITVTYVNSLTGSGSLSSTTTSPNLTCSLNPTSLTGSGSSTLSCSGSVGGSFNANVTATVGSTSHFVIVSYSILQGPDFNVTASPTTIGPVDAGASGTSMITVNALRGFSGTVNLSTTPSAGLTATVSPTSITGSGTATLTVSAAAAGDYTVTVTAANSTTSHSTSLIHVTVVDFGLVANRLTLSIPSGEFRTSNITLTALNGFTGTVSLSAVSSTGLTSTLTPNSISGSALSVLNITASNSIAAGSYSVNVTGMSGVLTHTIEIVVTVPTNDFTIASSPSTIPVAVNADGTSTITLSSVASFSGTVTLTVSLPTGVTGSLSPISVVLVKGGTGVSTLTVNASIAGSFLVNVTGTSGSLSHTITVTVVASVPDFTVQSSVNSVTVNAGAQGTATITVSPVNSFTGTVALASSISPVSGLTCSLTPSSIVLGVSQTSTLSCGGSAGSYTVTVTGTSGSLSHQVSVTYNVADFAVSASPTSVSALAGASASSTVTVAPVNAFTGTVALTTIITPAGLTCAFNPANIVLGVSQTSTLSCSGSAGTYTVTVSGTSGGLSHTATVTYSVTDFTLSPPKTNLTVNRGVLGNATITVAPVNGFAGTVALTSSVSSSGLACSLNPSSIVLGSAQTFVLSCSSQQATTFAVTITATSGSLSHSVEVDYAVADIQLTSQGSISVAENQTSFVSVSVTSVDGFSGPVNVALQPLTTNGHPPPLPLISLDQSIVTLSPNGVVQVLLNITVLPRSPAGTYGINFTATSGTLSASASIVLTVPRPDFSLTINPPADTSAIIITPGANGVAGFTVASLLGFNGSVTFSFAVNPSSGLVCSFSSTSLVLVPGKTNGTSITCHGSAGGYDVTVTAVATELYSTGTTHIANVGYTVVDFTLKTTPSGILVNTDQQGHAQINATWAHGYSGSIALSAVPTSGLSASISPSTLSGSGLATLTVSSATAGVYQVVVNATSGGTSHTATVTVTVSSVSNTSNIFGVDPATFYSIIGILIVAIVAGAVLFLRRGKRSKK